MTGPMLCRVEIILHSVTPKVNVTAYTLLPEVNLWVGTLPSCNARLLCRGLTRPRLWVILLGQTCRKRWSTLVVGLLNRSILLKDGLHIRLVRLLLFVNEVQTWANGLCSSLTILPWLPANRMLRVTNRLAYILRLSSMVRCLHLGLTLELLDSRPSNVVCRPVMRANRRNDRVQWGNSSEVVRPRKPSWAVGLLDINCRLLGAKDMEGIKFMTLSTHRDPLLLMCVSPVFCVVTATLHACRLFVLLMPVWIAVEGRFPLISGSDDEAWRSELADSILMVLMTPAPFRLPEFRRTPTFGPKLSM